MAGDLAGGLAGGGGSGMELTFAAGQILDAVGSAVVATDPDARIVFWNEAAEELFGWRASEVLGLDLGALLAPERVVEGAGDALEDVRQGGSWSGDMVARRHDGSLVTVATVERAVCDESGAVVGMVGVSRDVTVYRTSAAELTDSRDRLRLALRAGRLGTWQWDRLTGATALDETLETLLGLSPGSFAGTLDAWLGLIHPDDRAPTLAVLEGAGDSVAGFSLAHRVVWPDGSVHWLEGAGDVTLDREGRPAGAVGCMADTTARRQAEADRRCLLEAERAARRAAEQAAARLAGLQTVTAGLAAAVDQQAVAEVVLVQGLSGLGGHTGSLCLLTDDGRSLELVREVGYRPEVAQEWKRFPVDAPVPAGDAVRSGRMVLLASLEERDRRYPAIAGAPSTTRAFAVIPLVLEDGPPLGTLTIGFLEPREFSEDDQRFLGALAAQCAQALDRARLAAAGQEARRRVEFLAEASRVLASSLDHEATLGRVARLALPELAESCSVVLAGTDGLQVAALAHRDPAKEELMRALARREGARIRNPQIVDVHATGRAMLFPGVSDELLASIAEDAGHLDMLRTLAMHSGLVVPLVARGRRLGAMSLTRSDAYPPFGAEDLAFFEDWGQRAATAIENALAHRRLTEEARTLQRSLLPPTLPAIPGLELAARYHPVGDGSEVGGDFYDAFRLSDGRWAVVIGDVCGKGVEAASLTALARHTVRAAAHHQPDPAAVLACLNQAIIDAAVGERFCTMVYALVAGHGAGARLTVAVAGHPLPMVVSPEGRARPCGRPGSAVGLLAEVEVSEQCVELAPGDALVLFTDGVVEARSPEGRFAPPGLLVDALAAAPGADADAMADHLEATVLDYEGGRPRDDMAILVLRVPPGPSRPVRP